MVLRDSWEGLPEAEDGPTLGKECGAQCLVRHHRAGTNQSIIFRNIVIVAVDAWSSGPLVCCVIQHSRFY